MKLSTRCHYGTRAMIEIARNYNNGPVKRKDIARIQGIPSNYLENILITLKSRDLIRTVRGANGGFTLKEKPENITMLEIVTALEGSFAPVNCIESLHGCKRSGFCITHHFWRELYASQMKVLEGTNLQTLLDIEKRNFEMDYSI